MTSRIALLKYCYLGKEVNGCDSQPMALDLSTQPHCTLTAEEHGSCYFTISEDVAWLSSVVWLLGAVPVLDRQCFDCAISLMLELKDRVEGAAFYPVALQATSPSPWLPSGEKAVHYIALAFICSAM